VGTNRDYKTADRRARRRLAEHSYWMAKLVSAGYEKAEASRLALAIMEKKTTLEQLVAPRAS
jgi:hypothetical protein